MFAATLFAGKRVAVFGLARSGISCAAALKAGGADVFAWDDAGPSIEKAEDEGIPIKNLHEMDFADLDALVLSPGVPFTHPDPHWTVTKAKAAGVEIIADTELFCREAAAAGATVIGVTGTNGKSTTTALIAHVLKSAGLDVDMGGNIGLAVFNLRKPVRDRVYVLELSSFQLDLMPNFRPQVGVLTNLTADHLDRHGTMQNYAAVKAKMFRRQKTGDLAILGVDDPWTREIAADIAHLGVTVQKISVQNDVPDGIAVLNGGLLDNGANVLDISDMQSLRGKHNWQNAAIAYAVARWFGIGVEDIRRAMLSFPGLAHRMQQIANLGSIIFVNDSKATNADAAAKALSSFENIFWIAGGIAKSGGIESLQPLFGRIAKTYLIGLAAAEFARTLDAKVPYVSSGTLDQAVLNATEDAKQFSGGNPVVLLSPACSSFDQYKNFEIRGEAFVNAVSRIPGVNIQTGRET